MLHEIAGIVVGMISPIAAIEIELHRQSWKPQVILKRYEVRAASERGQFNLKIGRASRAPLRRLRFPLLRPPVVIDAAPTSEAGNILGDLDQKITQRRRAASRETASHEQVRVDVNHCLLAKLALESLRIFG